MILKRDLGLEISLGRPVFIDSTDRGIRVKGTCFLNCFSRLGRAFLMKQVNIIDQGLGQGKTRL
jgi:hypothetical protein